MRMSSQTVKARASHVPFASCILQQVLRRVAEKGDLVTVALNTHGTRAVQKLVETLSSREQRQIVIDALRPGMFITSIHNVHVFFDHGRLPDAFTCSRRAGRERADSC